MDEKITREEEDDDRHHDDTSLSITSHSATHTYENDEQPLQLSNEVFTSQSTRDETLRRIVYPKMLYFTLYGGWACLLPFLPLHFSKVGLDDSQIGVIGFISRLVGLAVIPIWSAVADKMKDKYKNILLLAILGYIVSMTAISQFRTFISLAILTAIAQSFGAPIGSLVDTSILQLLSEHHGKSDFGKQRLWASISWGILALLIGWAVTKTSIAIAFLRSSFGFFICLTAIEIAVFFRYKYQPEESNPPLADIRKFFSSGRNILFYVLIFAMGYGNGVVDNFLGPRVQSLGGDERILGAANFIDCFAELPFYFFSSWMITRFGYTGVLSLSALCFSLRLTIYSLIRNPWMCLLAEPLHGITFAAMWAAAVSYSDTIAPPGLSASAQGILGNVFFGIGPGIGSLIGGVLTKKIGATGNFLTAAAIVGCGLLIFVCGHLTLKFHFRKNVTFSIPNHSNSSKNSSVELVDTNEPSLNSISSVDGDTICGDTEENSLVPLPPPSLKGK